MLPPFPKNSERSYGTEFRISQRTPLRSAALVARRLPTRRGCWGKADVAWIRCCVSLRANSTCEETLEFSGLEGSREELVPGVLSGRSTHTHTHTHRGRHRTRQNEPRRK